MVDAPLDDLREWERNPRRFPDSAMTRLQASLVAEPEMLQARPLIALPDGTVIAGNMRLRAAQLLGWQSIPTVYVDLDESRAAEWALRDNASYGQWDEPELSALLLELQADGARLELTGFDEDELARLLASPENELPADIDDVGPLPEEPRSVPGEVYELGPHRLTCGDATDPAALAILMDGAEAACMWTDPPYGVDYESRGRRMRADALGLSDESAGIKTIDNDRAAGLPALLADSFAAVDGVLATGAPVYIAHPAGALHRTFLDAFEGVGWKFRQGLVWDKGRMVLGHSDYHYSHEPILYGNKPGGGRRGRGGRGWYGDNAQISVFAVPMPTRSDDHPTMKPVELVRLMLANSLPPNGTVLDPFAGSGSTLLAAHALGRRAALMEIDPRYCDVIRARWEAL